MGNLRKLHFELLDATNKHIVAILNYVTFGYRYYVLYSAMLAKWH